MAHQTGPVKCLSVVHARLGASGLERTGSTISAADPLQASAQVAEAALRQRRVKAVLFDAVAQRLAGINRRRQPVMGLTTLTALVLRGQSYTLAHVGDSRAYLLRGGTTVLLTSDHVVLHPDFKHQLLRSVGAEDHLMVDYLQGDLCCFCRNRCEKGRWRMQDGRKRLCFQEHAGFALSCALRYSRGRQLEREEPPAPDTSGKASGLRMDSIERSTSSCGQYKVRRTKFVQGLSGASLRAQQCDGVGQHCGRLWRTGVSHVDHLRCAGQAAYRFRGAIKTRAGCARK